MNHRFFSQSTIIMLAISLLWQLCMQAQDYPPALKSVPTFNFIPLSPSDREKLQRDNFIESMDKKFSKQFDDEDAGVKYIDGKLFFFSTGSILKIAEHVWPSLLGLSLGLAGIYVSYKSHFDLRTLVASLVFLGAGGYFGKIVMEHLQRILSTEPYIIFDEEGLIYENKRQFSWNQLGKINSVKTINVRDGNKMDVTFLDNKTGKVLFKISDEFLFDDLTDFANYAEYYYYKALPKE